MVPSVHESISSIVEDSSAAVIAPKGRGTYDEHSPDPAHCALVCEESNARANTRRKYGQGLHMRTITDPHTLCPSKLTFSDVVGAAFEGVLSSLLPRALQTLQTAKAHSEVIENRYRVYPL